MAWWNPSNALDLRGGETHAKTRDQNVARAHPAATQSTNASRRPSGCFLRLSSRSGACGSPGQLQHHIYVHRLVRLIPWNWRVLESERLIQRQGGREAAVG